MGEPRTKFDDSNLEMGENNLGVFLFFLISYCMSAGFFGVCIIPKWRIEVPGPIAKLFLWFWELRKFDENLDP